jgi:hypothetical protein
LFKRMNFPDGLLGGDAVTVEEKLGSETAARWDRIAGRVVTLNKKFYFTGGLLLLPNPVADEVVSLLNGTVKRSKAKLRRDAKNKGESIDIDDIDVKRFELSGVNGSRLFTQAWLVDALERINAPLPEMYNTDGDKILISEVHFPVKGDEAEIARIVDGIESLERNTTDDLSWSWHGKGSPSRRIAAKKIEGLTLQSVDDIGRTALGHLEINNGALLLSTNSRERAEKGRDLLASHLCKLVGAPLISHQDIQQMLDEPAGPTASKADEIPPEAAAEILGNYFDDHYRRVLDEPLPMFDGKTPRQAAKTKRGRALVIDWLKHLENGEYRRAAADGQKPYDMTWMWEELKVGDAP